MSIQQAMNNISTEARLMVRYIALSRWSAKKHIQVMSIEKIIVSSITVLLWWVLI